MHKQNQYSKSSFACLPVPCLPAGRRHVRIKLKYPLDFKFATYKSHQISLRFTRNPRAIAEFPDLERREISNQAGGTNFATFLQQQNLVARPGWIEHPTCWFEASHSIQLSYGRVIKSSLRPTINRRSKSCSLFIPHMGNLWSTSQSMLNSVDAS